MDNTSQGNKVSEWSKGKLFMVALAIGQLLRSWSSAWGLQQLALNDLQVAWWAVDHTGMSCLSFPSLKAKSHLFFPFLMLVAENQQETSDSFS